MMNRPALLLAIAALPMLSGCVRTVASVVTAPVRVASKAVDWTTTSQSESDEKRGRQLRKQEEERGKLDGNTRSTCANAGQARNPPAPRPATIIPISRRLAREHTSPAEFVLRGRAAEAIVDGRSDVAVGNRGDGDADVRRSGRFMQQRIEPRRRLCQIAAG